MKPTVYIETSVVSYLTARPGRDLVAMAHQQLTQEWWKGVLPRLAPYVSAVVLDEISRGDREAKNSWRFEMGTDRIVNQVRKTRKKVDLQFPDSESYYRHLKELQTRYGRTLTRRSPRPSSRARAS